MELWLWVCACVALAAAGGPEQVHISFGYQPSQMIVMWSTEDYGDSVVMYGQDQFHLNSKQSGSCWRFTYGNPRGLQYMHRVLLEGLKPGADYWYYVETSGNASDMFYFTSMPAGLSWSPKLLVYGDMGKEGGSQSLPALYKEAASGDYSAILHVGDFAYDLDSDGGEVQ
jgi:phosphodiesterase/alkaline phosphatase D-like protein